MLLGDRDAWEYTISSFIPIHPNISITLLFFITTEHSLLMNDINMLYESKYAENINQQKRATIINTFRTIITRNNCIDKKRPLLNQIGY